MTRTAPVYAGVADGSLSELPDNAEVGYQQRLTRAGQSTDYALRENGDKAPTLVADGARRPLLGAASV